MRTNLRSRMMAKVIPILLCLFLANTTASQIDSPPSIQNDSVIPLNCVGPILDEWIKTAEKDIAKVLERPTVRVAYLIPSNRTPQPRGKEALQKIITTARDFFSSQMSYNGLEPKTLHYETETDGTTPLVHVVDISETDVQIRGQDQFEAWTNTIRAAQAAGLGIWQRGQVWLLVAETHEQQSDGSILGSIALGGSQGTADDPGVAIIHSTTLSLIAQDGITDNRAYHGLNIPEIGPYPLVQNRSFPWFEGSTLSSVVSSNLGAVIHEMTHSLGIYKHDFRNDINFHGNLTGHGLRGIRGTLHPNLYPNDYTRLSYLSSHILNVSHYFNDDLERNENSIINFSAGSSAPQNGQLVFNISTADRDGLAVIRLCDARSDYSVESILNTNSWDGQISTPFYSPGTNTDFELIIYDRQGNKSSRLINLTPQPGNQSPWPNMHFTPPIGNAGDQFTLEATRSYDPDGDNPLTIEWDFNNDDVYDTPPGQSNLSTMREFPAGNHLIKSRVTDVNGFQTVSTPVALHAEGDITPLDEITFTLIDACKNEVIPGYDPIEEGATLNLLMLPAKLNIRANIPNGAESVRFDIDDQKAIRVENVAPYALFGDHNGDYFSDNLGRGKKRFMAEAFSGDNASGHPIAFGSLELNIDANSGYFQTFDTETGFRYVTFSEGDEIDYGLIEGKKLNVLTPHSSPVDNLKVQFRLEGPITRTWTEHYYPYALFGDQPGYINGQQFLIGDYNLRAFFAEKGEAFDLSCPNIEVNFTIKPPKITGFHFKTESDRYATVFEELVDGRTYYPQQGKFFKEVAIKATASATVGSVILEISGPINHRQVENIAPYSLFGDIPGAEKLNAREFPKGHYVITATPYMEADGMGMAGIPLTVEFYIEISDTLPIGFIQMYSVDSGMVDMFIGDLFTSTDVKIIDPAVTPTNNVTILAGSECDFGPRNESMVMTLVGPVSTSRIENERPFSLFGDQDDRFNGMHLVPGDYTISVTPYSKDNAEGVEGTTVTRFFKILGSNDFMASKILLYPNPATREIYLENKENKESISGQILDLSGRVVMNIPENWDGKEALNISTLSKGIYLMKLQSGDKQITKKLIVQ